MIHLINADVIAGLHQLPDQSVQCCVTSPPYWGLRDYGVEGQIGLEKTPEEYVNKMVGVFREVKRVLRNDGTLWLNLGDCYASNNPHHNHNGEGNLTGSNLKNKAIESPNSFVPIPSGFKQKDLVGMPWRVALALQKDGWYLRSDIIWNKPNPMPSSVEDRPTTSHEYIFLLTKSAKYFYDGEAIREPASQSYIDDKRPVGVLRQRVNKKSKYPDEGQFKKQDLTGNPTYTGFNERYRNRPAQMAKDNFKGHSGNFDSEGNQLLDGLTRNRRSVWTITTQARPEAHFATFPDELPRVCISAGTSEAGCCSVCGTPWKRRLQRIDYGYNGEKYGQRVIEASGGILTGGSAKSTLGSSNGKLVGKNRTLGFEPACKCEMEDTHLPPSSIPCTVLDPFGGSGTTAKVARELNRDAILIEIKPEYIQIARKILRLNEQLVTS